MGAAELVTGSQGDEVHITGRSLNEAKGEQTRTADYDQLVALSGGSELLTEGCEKLIGSVFVCNV